MLRAARLRARGAAVNIDITGGSSATRLYCHVPRRVSVLLHRQGRPCSARR